MPAPKGRLVVYCDARTFDQVKHFAESRNLTLSHAALFLLKQRLSEMVWEKNVKEPAR